ncbi:hypothetical protein C8Q75DRAFT_742570 [Abortiporus biennis]|nr:hypothetical protein C8Q75DRAFT_742570 [Abortiporus biennis]
MVNACAKANQQSQTRIQQLEAELEIARTEIERLEQVNAELKRDAKKPELSALRIGHSIHSSVSSNSSPKSLSRSIRGTRREQSTRDGSIHQGPRKQSLWEKGPVRGDDAMSVDEQSHHSEALGSEVPTEEGNATISIHIRNPLRQNELERWEFDSCFPPMSSNREIGPLSARFLAHSLGYGDPLRERLERLQQLKIPGIRVYIKTSYAFIYDPHCLNGPSTRKSYLIGWESTLSSFKLINHLSKKVPKNSIYHTFTCPKDEKSWYYLGAMSWNVEENVPDIWPTLNTDLQKDLAGTLHRSWRCGLEADEIMQKFKEGELAQRCISLSTTPEADEMSESIGAILEDARAQQAESFC